MTLKVKDEDTALDPLEEEDEDPYSRMMEYLDVEEKGPYADWTGLVRESTRSRLDTLEDFLPDADLSDKQLRQIVLDSISLGRWQLDARCNNRHRELAALQRRIAAFANVSDGSSDRQTGRIAEALGERVTTVLEGLREKARVCALAILRAEENGDGKDVGRLRAALTASGDRSVGQISLDLTFFSYFALLVCRGTEHGTRRRHVQAILARRLETDTEEAAKLFAEQRKRTGRQRRAADTDMEG